MMEFWLIKEGFNPWWTRVLFWSDWTSWDLMGLGSSCLVVPKFGWSAHVISSCWDLCVGWVGSDGLCSWAPLGLVIPTKWRVLPWVIYMGFCSLFDYGKISIVPINFVERNIFERWVIYISHELETLAYVKYMPK